MCVCVCVGGGGGREGGHGGDMNQTGRGRSDASSILRL